MSNSSHKIRRLIFFFWREVCEKEYIYILRTAYILTDALLNIQIFSYIRGSSNHKGQSLT